MMILAKMLHHSETRSVGWRVVLSSLTLTALAATLLLGGAGIAILLGAQFGHIGLYIVFGFIGISAMSIILILRQNTIAALVTIAVHVYVDFYLGIGLHIIAQVMALALLVIFYLTRSPRYPWERPRALWLWVLFLALCIGPTIRGAVDLEDILLYYPNIILGALILFWLGTVIVPDTSRFRLLWTLLAVFATLVALHTIIQEVTGKTLFATSVQDAFLQRAANYQLGPTNVSRAGSFFSDPDYNGAFLSMMLFIPLGLFVTGSSLFKKAAYLVATFLILLALLFTYSGGAWAGAFAGFVAYLLFVGRTRYRLLIPGCMLIGATMLVLFFPAQIALLLQHVTGSDELSLRVAIWQASLRVLLAFPLTGIGLSHTLFLQIATQYAVAARYIPIDHPHDSYLEFGAMAGFPVLLVFVALLCSTLWRACSQWRRAGLGNSQTSLGNSQTSLGNSQTSLDTRPLIGAGIAAVVALSVCSLVTNGWTLPPLAAVGWLLLGAMTSPLLSQGLDRERMESKRM